MRGNETRAGINFVETSTCIHLNINQYLLSSFAKPSTIFWYSLLLSCFSARITSVIMYKIDKIIRRSVESANETVIFRVATLAVTVFLELNCYDQNCDKAAITQSHTYSISKLRSSTTAGNTPNWYIIITLDRVQTCCSWSDCTSAKHPCKYDKHNWMGQS